MTARGKEGAALALHRFGFGPAADLIAAIATDPQGALLADLERPQAGLVAANLPSSGEQAREVFDFRAEQAAKQKLALRAQKQVDAGNAASLVDCRKPSGEPCAAPLANDAANQQPPPSPITKPAQPPTPPLPQQLFQDEAKARFDAALGADLGFVERLVWFWSNHFCISADKIVEMPGPFEREAIRPHVLGRFSDLLLAVESHPGMLFYLDNIQSMGANSIAGINRDKGLNENLAREILELHTLGVRSGYTQADVTSFANVITGWTWIPPEQPVHGGEFAFVPRLHEPGAKTVLGKVYPDTGAAQGRAVLADLARHPATAQHIAQKLARHFVADEPPPSLVAKLAKTFSDSDGSLKAVAKTLVTADEFVDAAAHQAQTACGMDDRHAALDDRATGHSRRPHLGHASGARRGAVAAAVAERLSRLRGGLDRWRAAPAGYRDRTSRAACGEQRRSACRSRQRARSARFGRNA